VVITSSVAAVGDLKAENMPNPRIFNETHWSEPDSKTIKAYPKSKTLAEMAAWDFQKSLPEEDRFEIVTINPGLILGPAIISGSEFSSGIVINKMLNNGFPMLPRVKMPIVDVQTVARAHLNAVKNPEAAN
jgi:dihydroflavonol-4-reductase